MCMITFVPAGIVPGTEQFASIDDRVDEAHYINNDGHGFMIATPEGVWSRKGMSFGKIYSQYERALAHARSLYGSVPSAFHSRIGTAGPNDATLCHPFTLGEPTFREVGGEDDDDSFNVMVTSTAMMHNGILPTKYQPSLDNRTDSDTSLYVRDVLPIYINAKTGVPGRRAAARIASIIGTGNKFLIFGSVNGKVTVRLINSDSGTWEDDGAWYSSQYYARRNWMQTYTPGTRRWVSGSYSGSNFGDPPAALQAAEEERPAMRLMESTIYHGWYRRPQDPSGPYWRGDTYAAQEDAEEGEVTLPWRSNRAAKGLPCTCGSKDWGDQNYCKVCGECGDCSESVVLCSCLSEGNKPEYAWEAWSAFYADSMNM